MFDPFGVLCCGDLILPRIVTMDIFLLLQVHFTTCPENISQICAANLYRCGLEIFRYPARSPPWFSFFPLPVYGRMYAGELFPSPLLFASCRCACGDTLDRHCNRGHVRRHEGFLFRRCPRVVCLWADQLFGGISWKNLPRFLFLPCLLSCLYV